MGDFDRVQNSGQKPDAKKLGLMIVLGVVLVGVLVFHFTKQGPQSAEASVVPMNFTAPGPAESNQTPDVALSALQEDPTEKLLRNNVVDDPSLSQLPRNPFRMANTWLATLVKPKPVVEVPKPVEAQRPTMTKNVVPLKIEDYKLQMTYQRAGKLMALINNKEVTTGRTVDKARVLEITQDSVTLQNIESPDAPPITLSTESKLK